MKNITGYIQTFFLILISVVTFAQESEQTLVYKLNIKKEIR